MSIKIKVPCQIFSRIVGYYRPLSSWNKAKRREFEDRKNFHLPDKDELDKKTNLVGI